MSRSAIPSASALLAWYDRHRRVLPWRALPGVTPDPYRVWLSEIMLQQTGVTAAIPYYENFVRQFPDVKALAEAPLEAVLVAWAGLGYYARARNLHECAHKVVKLGGFPHDPAALLALPGIGPYTATAIAAIAFGIHGVPVDGNVERVTARVFAIAEPMPGAKPALRAAASRLGADPEARARPSDFAQALFDLGATLCTPTQPACGICPWTDTCAARSAGITAELPRKAMKKPRPIRFGAHFWLTDAAGNLLLRRRPPEGLLGGMTELPGTAWRAEPWSTREALAHAPAQAPWRDAGEVRHVFTHFELRLNVFAARLARLPRQIAAGGFLRPIADLAGAALPSVMRKCVTLGMQTERDPPHVGPPVGATQ